MTRPSKTNNTVCQRTDDLIEYVFSELQNWSISAVVGKTRALGDASWSEGERSLQIRINRSVRDWPDPAIIGLLAHELSHPLVGYNRPVELSTDRHVLKRGLGVYLAFERAFIGRYHDHTLKGKDRYLGFQSIREELSPMERDTLDRLLGEFRLIPHRQPRLQIQHDIVRGGT